jgi:hypothetical protein
LLLAPSGVEALDNISVTRYTYIGPKSEQGNIYTGQKYWEEFTVESGTLFCKEGFINGGGGIGTLPLAEHSDRKPEIVTGQLELVEELKAVSGKFIIELARYMEYGTLVNCFPRSGQTFSIAGGPYVAITNDPNGESGNSGGVSSARTISISANFLQASETGPTNGQFLIAADKAVSKTIKVQYKIGGTAKKNADYKPVSGTATILAGNVSTTVTIIPKDDRKKEPT